MVYVIETIVNGGKVEQDYKQHGYADGDVKLTDLNENVAAAGTADKLAEVEAALADGSLQVFDTSRFTVGGKELKSAFALDTDGDFTPDKEEAVFDGAFHESLPVRHRISRRESTALPCSMKSTKRAENVRIEISKEDFFQSSFGVIIIVENIARRIFKLFDKRQSKQEQKVKRMKNNSRSRALRESQTLSGSNIANDG